MTDSVYRVTEVIGTSATSWEEAAKNAVETAAKTLRDLRVGEVVKFDVSIENGKVTSYRARVNISFNTSEMIDGSSPLDIDAPRGDDSRLAGEVAERRSDDLSTARRGHQRASDGSIRNELGWSKDSLRRLLAQKRQTSRSVSA